MGLIAHILSARFAAIVAPVERAALATDAGTGPALWSETGRELIDRRSNLAEHPLQSGVLHGIHMTITGKRFTAGM
jgi:hypothetical protein